MSNCVRSVFVKLAVLSVVFAAAAGCSGGNKNPPHFASTGDMTAARWSHTATLLPNGMVLVAGGDGFGSAELYSPATGAFTATGSMSSARQSHTATLLPNGLVLIAGGDGFDSAELYDPNAGTFAATGSMTAARQSHTAMLLPNGRVLVVGGLNYAHDTMNSTPPPFVSPELYDPAAGTFSATGNVTVARRQNHTATLLHNGMVLIAGGNGDDGGLASGDVYDPATGEFSATGSMSTARAWHTATLLRNGHVLIAGGAAADYTTLLLRGPFASTELYQ